MLTEQAMNFNDEARMTNDEGSPNAQMIQRSGARVRRRTIGALLFRHSDFVIPSCFVICHSSFESFAFTKGKVDRPLRGRCRSKGGLAAHY
jgi:hypothetical protein